MQKITVLGTDARYTFAARELEKYGFTVSSVCDRDALAVVIPINQRTNAIKTPRGEVMISDAARIAGRAVFFGGEETEEIRAALCGRRYFDLTKNEEFAAENAILTAEGALGIMIDKTPFSVRGARVAVLGYGRIGRALSGMLVSLGAAVTVFARRDEARRDAEKICRALDFSGFDAGFDVVVNTVPARVLTEAQTEKIGGAYVIELASAPYGFSDEFSSRLGARYIKAPGLPGKTAPESAGKIIAKAIYDIIKGEQIK